jgi:hypothetical protein
MLFGILVITKCFRRGEKYLNIFYWKIIKGSNNLEVLAVDGIIKIDLEKVGHVQVLCAPR